MFHSSDSNLHSAYAARQQSMYAVVMFKSDFFSFLHTVHYQAVK